MIFDKDLFVVGQNGGGDSDKVLELKVGVKGGGEGQWMFVFQSFVELQDIIRSICTQMSMCGVPVHAARLLGTTQNVKSYSS